jgi:hypothetical protein
VGEGKLRATEFQAFTAVPQMQVRLFVGGSHPISPTSACPVSIGARKGSLPRLCC